MTEPTLEQFMIMLGLTLLLAQSSQPIRPDTAFSERICSACRVALKTVVALGAAGDTAGDFADTQILRVSAAGNFYLPKITYRDRIVIYDRAGAFLRSVRFDSLGEGNIGTTYLGSKDSVFIFNNGRSQLVHVDATKGPSVVSAFPGSVYSALRLGDGRWVVNGVFRTPRTLGLPLHILTRSGVIQSFGSRTREHRPDRPFEGWRHVLRASSGEVLSLSYTDPTIERWTTKGEYKGSLSLKLPEFLKPRSGQSRWSETVPPYSVIEDAKLGSDGLLWLIVTTAAPSWKSAIRSVASPDGGMPLPVDWQTALSSWIIVVDEETGDTVLAARFNEYLRQFVSDSYVSALRGRPNAQQTLSILSIESVLPTRKK